MPVHPVSDPPYDFSHSKGSQNRSDPQPLNMPKESPGHKDGQCQTGHVKTDLHPGIGKPRDLRKFPGKKIRRRNRHLTSVSQSDSKADQQITDTEIQDLKEDPLGQKSNPGFMEIHRYTEEKSHHKTEQIGQMYLSPENKQGSHQEGLEYISPGSQGNLRKHLIKGIRNTGNGRNPRPGIQHQHDCKTVYKDQGDQRQFPSDLYFFLFHKT